MTWLKSSIFGLSLFLAAQSAWADITCTAQTVTDVTENKQLKGMLCALTVDNKRNTDFTTGDPISALQKALKDTVREGREACAKEKMVSAGDVDDFNSNSFLFTSIGVVNGSKGAVATLTGRILCVEGTGQSTYSISNQQ